jgi:hypothetical protein
VTLQLDQQTSILEKRKIQLLLESFGVDLSSYLNREEILRNSKEASPFRKTKSQDDNIYRVRNKRPTI